MNLLPPTECHVAAPAAAMTAGYSQLVFDSDMNIANIGSKENSDGHLDWFTDLHFTKCIASKASISRNTSGSTRLNGVATACQKNGDVAISTVATDRTSKTWQGRAFGGGGYVEVEMAFDPANVFRAPIKSQWPAFWMMAVEHLANLPSEQAKGMAKDYSRFAEIDIFEYDVWAFAGHNSYGSAVHDWFGQYKTTCPKKAYCSFDNSVPSAASPNGFIVYPPQNFLYSDFHRYGALWIPRRNDYPGYIQFYLDGVATDIRVEWPTSTVKSDDEINVPFEIIDNQNFAILISTGLNQRIDLRCVRVWQSK